MAHHAIPQMRKRGSGAIVNMSSIRGSQTTPHNTPYAAAKAGILGFTHRALWNWRPRASVSTPSSPAPSTPPRPTSSPSERLAAEACLFLCSEASSFVTGASFAIDGEFLARLWNPQNV